MVYLAKIAEYLQNEADYYTAQAALARRAANGEPGLEIRHLLPGEHSWWPVEFKEVGWGPNAVEFREKPDGQPSQEH
jgi:hypothetical protein